MKYFNDVYTLNNQYVVKFSRLTNDEVNVNGVDLKIDTRYNRQHHAEVFGEVVATCEDSDVKVGDKVMCQYLVVEDSKRLDQDEEGYYQLAERGQIFAIIRNMNEIIMLDEFILVKPEETDSEEFETNEMGFLVPKKETKGNETMAVVTHVGNSVTNVKVGDRVKLHKSAQYPIEIDGERYYRVRSNVGLIYKFK